MGGHTGWYLLFTMNGKKYKTDFGGAYVDESKARALAFVKMLQERE